MKDLSKTDPEYEQWLLLNQARDAVLKLRHTELGSCGITARQAGILFFIQASGGKATVAQISRWVFREPHSVSELLKRMEKKRLIKKTKNLSRKNQVRIAITEKGLEAHTQTKMRGTVRSIMAVLSEEERKQLWSALWKLRVKAFEELGIETEPTFPAPQ